MQHTAATDNTQWLLAKLAVHNSHSQRITAAASTRRHPNLPQAYLHTTTFAQAFKHVLTQPLITIYTLMPYIVTLPDMLMLLVANLRMLKDSFI
jgi:hypothetical protein